MTAATDGQTAGLRAAMPALLALAVGGFTIGTTEFASMGLVPLIADDLAVSVPTAGHAVTAYAVGVVAGAPTLTVLAARVERTRLLLILMGMFVVGHVLSALAGSMGLLIVARFLAGLPHGAFFGVGAVVGAAVAGPRNRGKAIGMMMAGLTIANMIGVPLTTRVGQVWGWRATFWIVAVLALLTMLSLWRLVPRGAGGEGSSVRDEVRALRNGPLWIAFAAGAIGFGGLFAVYTYVGPLVTEVGRMSTESIPLVMGLFGLAMTVGVLVGGRLVDRGVLRTVVLGFVTTLLALVLLGATGSAPVMLVVGLVALGVTSQVLGLAMQARLMDLSPLAPSLGAALCHSALNAGNAEGAFVGGLVIDAGWGYLATAWVGAALTAVGLLVVLAVGRQRTGLPVAERVRRSLEDTPADEV
ncbi:DHA1 family inner membrane transport protein [Flavimobilis soli]|uniref:DHA1 family inner membrane transport protein n=1 Tax=Flavimobilis soli TaxID=442709 RepID=A0A2A9E9U5_9MICO|nr:DHA1 family inner membrane transport protein [Flavimobilis soli]PFG37843.1 DHA1 family inner membrane transport protein [Flavimobilis soli]PFG37847.1 DHA1 family inner membrane transport protein [Flavimobilis soli]